MLRKEKKGGREKKKEANPVFLFPLLNSELPAGQERGGGKRSIFLVFISHLALSSIPLCQWDLGGEVKGEEKGIIVFYILPLKNASRTVDIPALVDACDVKSEE